MPVLLFRFYQSASCSRRETGSKPISKTFRSRRCDSNYDLFPARLALASQRRQSDKLFPYRGCPNVRPLPRQGWNKSRSLLKGNRNMAVIARRGAAAHPAS